MSRYPGCCQLIHVESLGRAAGHPWPQYSIHRGDLQSVLLAAVRERLGEDAVRLGVRLVTAEDDGSQVSAVVEAPEGQQVRTAGVLVGRDGVHSAVRRALYPDAPGLRYAGCTLWRGTTVMPPFLGGDCLVRAGWLAVGKMVVHPIRDDVDGHGNQLVDWVAELEGPQRSGRDWTREGSVDDMIRPFEDWQFDSLDVPAMIRGAETVLEYPMVDQEPLPR